jgi:hypothetical protein
MVLAGHQLHELGSIDAMHFDQASRVKLRLYVDENLP